MFEKEIRFISDFNLNKIKKLGSFFTITQLTAANIHPAIVQYISGELEYLILIDRERLLQKSVFDYSGTEINNHFALISSEIKKNKLIPYEDIKRLVAQAVAFNINFLLRPKWSLKKFIFDTEGVRTYTELKLFMNYVHFYDYYKKIILALIEKKKIISLSVYEFEDMLDKLEKQLLKNDKQTLIHNGFSSMAEFFNLGEIHQNKISVLLAEIFLHELGLFDEIFKIRKLLSVDPKQKFEIDDFRLAVSSNIQLDSPSDSQISERIFEMPESQSVFSTEIEPEIETQQSMDEFLDIAEDDFSFPINELDESLSPEEEFLKQEIADVSADNDELTTEDEINILDQVAENDVFPSDEFSYAQIQEGIVSILDFDVEAESSKDEEVFPENKPETNDELPGLEINPETTPADENKDDETESSDKSSQVESETKEDASEFYEKFINSDEEYEEEIAESFDSNNEDSLTKEQIIFEENASEIVEGKEVEKFLEELDREIETTTDDEAGYSSLLIERDERRAEQPLSKEEENSFLKTIESEIERLKNTNINDELTILDEISLSENVSSAKIENDKAEVLSFDDNDSNENLSVFDSEIFFETDGDAETIINWEDGTFGEEPGESQEIEEQSTESKIDEFDQVQDTDIKEVRDTQPIEDIAVNVSSDEIFNLFSEKETSKIIMAIFANDEIDFVHTVERISECNSFDQAIEILKSVFHSYRVNPLTSKEATIFKEKISYFFREREK